MEALQTLFYCLLFGLKIFTVYFTVVALFTLRPRRSWPHAAPKIRFAVVAAARNEEAVIADLIHSVQRQEYPPELVDVYIVPNNCTDGTEAAALSAGAQIIHCCGRVSGKGDALRQAFAQLMPRGYDAFLVLDADNTLAPDYLARMNDAFVAGAMVCKSRTKAANPTAGAVAGCYGLYNTSMDLVWNRARAACGLSAKLIGTGFAVRREVLERLGGWNTVTIAEDAEFASQLAGAGCRVEWVPEAVNYDEEPTSFLVSLRQRKRWISGIMQVGKVRLGPLWREDCPKPFLRWDMTMFLLMPFSQAISALLLIAGLLVTLLSGDLSALLVYFSGLGLSWLGGLAVGATLSLLGGYGLKGMLPAILLFPIFTASWMPLQVISLFHDTKKWHAVAHHGRAPAAVSKG